MTHVTIAVPAYCEGLALGANLVSLADYFSLYGSSYTFEYLIVDDGSTDETLRVANTFARFRPNVKVVSHPKNLGLGGSLRTIFAHATGDYIVTLDADMSYSADVAIRLLDAIERNGADVALASPYMRGGHVANVPYVRRLLSREANRFLSLATNGRYSTLTCMVRAYRRSFVTGLAPVARGMDVNAELVFLTLKNGGKIVEIPATLRWTDDRRTGAPRMNLRKTIAQTWATLAAGLHFRPALWLAIPGLVPGLLPAVVAVLLLLHVPARTLALGTAVTVAVQYTSLAIFAGQLTAFFTGVRFARHRVKVLKT
ncbi:MAG TPA: glycosyltransferase family 2 protein [Candidatus Baltobacteraceae bacterium]|nr:glycosyltransferase family 2 protein [Candidatus Baltobacteraceae bacterium]